MLFLAEAGADKNAPDKVRSSSRGAPRAFSALSATVPCVTLSPSGVQAGQPPDGALRKAAHHGALEEVRTLIEARANIEDPDAVSDKAGVSVAPRGYCGVVFDHSPGA